MAGRIFVDLSSCIIAGARPVRVDARAVVRQSKNWFLDCRSTLDPPNKSYLCLYSYAGYRFPSVNTDPFGGILVRVHDTLCRRNFLRAETRVSSRCEEERAGPADRFESRGAKNRRSSQDSKDFIKAHPSKALSIFSTFARFFHAGFRCGRAAKK